MSIMVINASVFVQQLPHVHGSNLIYSEKFPSVTQVPELEHQANYSVSELPGLLN